MALTLQTGKRPLVFVEGMTRLEMGRTYETYV